MQQRHAVHDPQVGEVHERGAHAQRGEGEQQAVRVHAGDGGRDPGAAAQPDPSCEVGEGAQLAGGERAALDHARRARGAARAEVEVAVAGEGGHEHLTQRRPGRQLAQARPGGAAALEQLQVSLEVARGELAVEVHEHDGAGAGRGAQAQGGAGVGETAGAAEGHCHHAPRR